MRSQLSSGALDPPPDSSMGSTPIVTNDEPAEAQKVKVGERPTWLSWKDVPRDPRLVAREGPWFLEVFSGTARLTAILRSMGIPCLPPIDIMV